MLRGVPEPLRRAVKAKAAAEGISLQVAAIELMRRWVEEK
jgi:predicted DNA binding CopG/RHH family protein